MAIKRTDNPAAGPGLEGAQLAADVGCWGGCWVSGCWGGCWPGVTADVAVREELLRQLSDLQLEVPERTAEGRQAVELLSRARGAIKASIREPKEDG